MKKPTEANKETDAIDFRDMIIWVMSGLTWFTIGISLGRILSYFVPGTKYVTDLCLFISTGWILFIRYKMKKKQKQDIEEQKNNIVEEVTK